METKAKSSGATATSPWWVRKTHEGLRGASVRRVLYTTFLLLTMAFFGGSCRHLPTPPSGNTGTSSFAFIEAPPKPRAAPTEGPVFDDTFDSEPSYFVEAKPLEPLTKPTYPPLALGSKAGLISVGVKVSIDAQGRVTDVGPSLVAFSTPTPYAREFQDAVRNAVMTWRFKPAQRSHVTTRQPKEGGDRVQYISWENTETSLDLSFTFTASGEVHSESSAK